VAVIKAAEILKLVSKLKWPLSPSSRGQLDYKYLSISWQFHAMFTSKGPGYLYPQGPAWKI